jgi:hypothetical protein
MSGAAPRPYSPLQKAVRRGIIWIFALVIAFLGPALSSRFRPWPWDWAAELNGSGAFRDLLMGAVAMGTLCIADLLLGIVLPADRQPRHEWVQVAALALFVAALLLTLTAAIRWGQLGSGQLDSGSLSNHVWAVLALLGVGIVAELVIGIEE